MFILTALIAATLSHFAWAHQSPLEINTLCAILMTPAQRTVGNEIDGLVGWFDADIEVKVVNFLPAGPNALSRERETVLRVAISRHTPIRGAHRSGEEPALAVPLPEELDIHLDSWDWSEREFPVTGLKLKSVPIQIMDWNERRYFRFAPTFVHNHLAPLLTPIAWDRWTHENRVLFVQAKMGARKPLPPGYRIYTGSLLANPVAGAHDVTLLAAGHAATKIQVRHPRFELNFFEDHVQWLTDAAGRLLAIHLKLYPDFEYFYDANGQPL